MLQALAHVPSYTKKLQEIRKDMDAVSNRSLANPPTLTPSPQAPCRP